MHLLKVQSGAVGCTSTAARKPERRRSTRAQQAREQQAEMQQDEDHQSVRPAPLQQPRPPRRLALLSAPVMLLPDIVGAVRQELSLWGQVLAHFLLTGVLARCLSARVSAESVVTMTQTCRKQHT